jgi:hypothetical protein
MPASVSSSGLPNETPSATTGSGIAFETGTYVIDFSRYYVLEMGPEAYYKVQFVDFYDEAGRKGSVKLRYSGL